MNYLACWLGEGSFHPANLPDISFRSQHSNVLGLIFTTIMVTVNSKCFQCFCGSKSPDMHYHNDN